jgi:spore coat polysaccharide biosynthesis protein SpsF
MGSSRLTGKVLLKLRSKPVLWHVVQRVSQSKSINKIIIATTSKPEDNILTDFCKENGLLWFRGNEKDVLDRYYKCAEKHGIKNILRITGDCPLIDPDIIEMVIEAYSEGNCDYASNTMEHPYPDGFNCEIFSFKALKYSWKNAKLISEREHVTPFIKKSKIFKKKSVLNNKYFMHQLSLDYLEDYQVIKRIFNGIKKDIFYIDDVYDFLKENPEIIEINEHIEVDEGYIKSLQEDKKFLR